MKIGVAISSFQSDDDAINLIQRILDESWPVDGIIVVDSMGEGGIPNFLSEYNIPKTTYHNFDYNLGSAGNLHNRLMLASERGHEAVVTVLRGSE